MCCADLRNRKGRAVAGRATDGCARLRTCRYGVSAYGCVGRRAQSHSSIISKWSRNPPRGGRVERVERVAAPLAGDRSQYAGGRAVADGETRRGGRRCQGSSTGPTPDAVEATRRASRSQHRRNLEAYPRGSLYLFTDSQKLPVVRSDSIWDAFDLLEALKARETDVRSSSYARLYLFGFNTED